MKKADPETAKLLKEYIANQGCTLTWVCKTTGLSYSSIKRIFRRNDMPLTERNSLILINSFGDSFQNFKAKMQGTKITPR